MAGDDDMSQLLFICQIWQKNNHTFSIKWNDEMIQDFRLSDLQRNCPCAQCADEITGQSLVDPKMVPDTVRAVVIRNVGRYGLRIQFTSGCSQGIYSFDRLRKMK